MSDTTEEILPWQLRALEHARLADVAGALDLVRGSRITWSAPCCDEGTVVKQRGDNWQCDCCGRGGSVLGLVAAVLGEEGSGYHSEAVRAWFAEHELDRPAKERKLQHVGAVFAWLDCDGILTGVGDSADAAESNARAYAELLYMGGVHPGEPLEFYHRAYVEGGQAVRLTMPGWAARELGDCLRRGRWMTTEIRRWHTPPSAE